MKQRLSSLIISLVVFVVLIPAFACARGELTLKFPEVQKSASLNGKKVYIKSVTDGRKFEDKPSSANIPSLAAGIANTPEEKMKTAIVRVRDGYGKARNNIFAVATQPVDEIVRKTVTAALISKGYTLVENAAEGDAGTITMDVTVDNFWGYILVKGSAWAGSSPVMGGEMKTTIKVEGGGATRTFFEASSTVTHKFGLMTGGHWVLMFKELMDAYVKGFPSDKF